MIKILLSDLDGTLNDMQDNLKTANLISLENLKALNKLANNNVKFGIVTGNIYSVARKSTSQIYNSKLLYAVQNGSTIKIGDKSIYCNYFSTEIFIKLINYLAINNLNFICEDENFEYIPFNITSNYLNILNNVNSNSNFKKVDVLHLKKICKIQVKCLENIEEFKLKLQIQFPNLTIVYGDDITIDIMNQNCSKGQAIKTIAKKLNYSLNEIAYIGDNDNDISAFEILEHSYIMTSANPKYYQYAKHKVENVAAAIENILKFNLINQKLNS